MRLFLCGPAAGLPDWNFPAFRDAARRLRAAGHGVIDPSGGWGAAAAAAAAAAAGDATRHRSLYVAACTRDVLDLWEWGNRRSEGQQAAVAVLPDWQHSAATRLGVALARELGLPVLDAATLEPIADGVLARVLATPPASASPDDDGDAELAAWRREQRKFTGTREPVASTPDPD